MEQNVLISSAEEQLKSFGAFLNAYDHKLQRLLDTTLSTTIKNVANEPIIEINYSANQEALTLMRLLESDRVLNKTLLTFAHLCAEVDATVAKARTMQMKLLYMDEELLCALDADSGNTLNGKQVNERILLKMSLSIEFLCNVQFLLQHCTVLGNNILHQCGAYLASCDGASLEFKFFNVFDCLAELLLQILTFDEILASSNFSRFWPNYKKTIEALSHNTAGVTAGICSNAEINGLQDCLQELDYLFTGTIFRNFLDSTFTLKDKIGHKGMGKLMQQFNLYVKYNLNIIDKFSSPDLNDFDEPKSLIRLNAFCVVFHDFCGQIEPKSVKHLMELNVKYQGVIILIGSIAWQPVAFLKKYAATLIKTHEKLIPDTKRQRQHFLQTRVQTLQRDCRTYCSQITLFLLNIRRSLSIGAFDLKVEQFKELATLLLLGLRYAGQISFLIKALVNAHIALQTPMTKSTLLAICKLIELLKMIQISFQDNAENIANIMQCILQYLQYKILHLLAACKKKITNSKLHDRNVDALAAIKIAEKCMNGPCSNSRILVTKLAINVTNSNIANDQYDKFTSIIQRIELLSNFQLHLKQVCDTSYIYWHQSMLSAYIKQIVDRKLDFNSFQYLIKTSESCAQTLNFLQLDNLKLSELYKKNNFDIVRNEIVSNLCAQIEIFLRLEVHSNLQLEKMNPFEQSINDYRDLINICPIELNGHYVVLKDHVENYLSAMFYNLTTISLHDWKTYEEMRHLANNRLMLRPVEDFLPNQTLEQGIDVLEIMRKINIFVSKYVYNMNTQIFVEQQSANKHLDSIGIRHVANSIRTHGTGVINTTVNFTYQFLRQKFYTFSQFLYDEQIKSRLMKELRSYAERKQTEKFPLFPYERADNFNKDIRKLGLSNDGQTYMDMFRKVITHIGNAMGYIRLVRSGSIHANYSASLYLPKFDENLNFQEKCKNLALHDVTIAAAEIFEINVSNLSKRFSDSTDYFKLLVEAFQPFFRNPHNIHLKNFFLIIPALTMNYVQYMLSVKDKINKKERHEAVLFDDGFAVGLAYILKLLNQINDFNALQWFGTVRERFNAERRKIKEMLADINSKSTSKNTTTTQKNENEKLQQTLALTERRINTHQMEYNLLYYNLCSAKIFFQ